MELFDASGVEGTGTGAQALADALSSLAKPLEQISKNTENLRVNPDLDYAMGFGPEPPMPPPMSETERNAKKAKEKEEGTGKTSGVGALRVALLERIARATEKMALGMGVGAASARMANVTSASPATANRMANVTSARRAGGGDGSMAAIMPALSGMASAATSVIGPLVAIGAAGLAAGAALAGLVYVSHKLVSAFDPSAVIGFDMAMRDLQAVFGLMLIPVINEATKVLRYFAGTIFASANTIMPAIQSLAKSVGDVFVALMPILGQLIPVFASMLKFTAELVSLYVGNLLPVLRAFSTVAAGIAAALQSAFGGLLGSTGKVKNFFVEFAQTLGRIITMLAAFTFRLLGMTSSLDAMLGSLKPGADAALRKDATGLASAQNAQIQSVGSLGSEVLKRAFQTAGRAGQASEDVNDQEFRNQLIKDITYLKNWKWQDELKTVIREAFTEGIPTPASVMRGLGNKAEDAGAFDAAARVGRAFGII